ncbi:MAG: hypothetical protein A2041_14135 [Bacteroidetes bacterium GWA2_31_9b]|nr:MAG: hypothetical protein A2041_14135 [Bacteroidetes bacterium GWA2_31_9b]
MKNIKKFLFLLFFLALYQSILFFPSCKHEPDAFSNLDTICFETQVLPIMQISCGISSCHNASTAKAGFISTDYYSVMGAVSPGNANGSELYKVITNINSTEGMMPPDRPLSKEQRTIIHIWIEQGAKNLFCSGDTTGHGGNIVNPDTICFTQYILPLLQSSCATTGCHDNITQEEGYNFTTYAGLMDDPESIVPFDPNESKVYEVIITNDLGDRMPPSPYSPLSDNQKEMFRRWVSEGALNSDCPDLACDTLNPILFGEQIYPLIDRSCIGCHNTTNASGGVMLDSYLKIKYYSETIRNGEPIIIGVVKKHTGFIAMPPYGTLDECTIRKMELWIEQGMLDN